MRTTTARIMATIVSGLAATMLGTGYSAGQAASGTTGQPGAGPGVGVPSTRFEALDVFVDSGTVPLAAYQLEVRAVGEGVAKLVGVEGGERGAFQSPPYYDPAILHAESAERVVLLSYSLKPDSELPRGETRVARLHLQVQNAATLTYLCTLAVAGDSEAREIKATSTARVLTIPPASAPAAAPGTSGTR